MICPSFSWAPQICPKDLRQPLGIFSARNLGAMQPFQSSHSPPIAIVGASYAGLTFANFLHLHSVPYVIYERKSLPFVHVIGGTKFKVPFFHLIAKELELDLDTANQCVTGNGPARAEVIESLLRRVKPNLITSQRIVGMEKRSSLFYLLTTAEKSLGENIAGPFRSIVGADGVHSKVRFGALQGTFLIGDARWVKDRWYDLGLCRIDRGANIALLDGVGLGKTVIEDVNDMMGCGQTITRKKYCAWEISQRKMRRQLLLLVMFVIMVAFYQLNIKENATK